MRISRLDALVEYAETTAKRGTCSRAQVGVVIARDGRVLVSGYNGAPAGMEHCDHRCNCNFMERWVENGGEAQHGKVLQGEHDEWCQHINPCKISVHAEANCFAYAARWGVKVEGAIMVSTVSPCLSCCQLVVNSGLTAVYYVKEHREDLGLELLRKAGIEVICLTDQDAIK